MHVEDFLLLHRTKFHFQFKSCHSEINSFGFDGYSRLMLMSRQQLLGLLQHAVVIKLEQAFNICIIFLSKKFEK